MNFTEIVAPTIKELFVHRIEDMILSGELSIGDRLPSERELAEQMKISKTAVHAGICDMARKGFLEVRPRKGIFVGDYASNGTLEALESIIQHGSGRLDDRNIRSMLEMRYAIEIVSLFHVVKAQDAQVLDKLRSICAEVDTLLSCADDSPREPDYAALAELFFRFHHTICIASGNTIAPLIFNAFHTPSVAFWTNSARALGAEESVRRLRTFVELIEQGNLDALQAHLRFITDTADVIVREMK